MEPYEEGEVEVEDGSGDLIVRDKGAAHRSQEFFDRLSPQYQNLIRRKRFLEWMRPIIEPRMGGRVLDVGNGGIREFVSPRTSLYVGLDSSMEMLREGRDGSIEKVCGEAMRLAFKRGVFDTIFYQSLLHHLAEKSFKRTVEKVIFTLLQGAFCLKEEGKVMIIEPCLPRSLERAERIFFFSSSEKSFHDLLNCSSMNFLAFSPEDAWVKAIPLRFLLNRQ